MENLEFLKSFLFMMGAIVLYFLPAFIANHRKHRNTTPIFLTTLFFGWTIAAWLVCLIWSTSGNVEPKIKAMQ